MGRSQFVLQKLALPSIINEMAAQVCAPMLYYPVASALNLTGL
jgi:hypothetical protein